MAAALSRAPQTRPDWPIICSSSGSTLIAEASSEALQQQHMGSSRGHVRPRQYQVRVRGTTAPELTRTCQTMHSLYACSDDQLISFQDARVNSPYLRFHF